MARYRLSGLAQADLERVLATSAERWGSDGRRRYANLLVTGIRQLATDPEGPLTRPRVELGRSVRSFHLGHVRDMPGSAHVGQPVHVLYYRVATDGVLEIARVLHERMEPSRYLDEDVDRPLA